MEIVLGWQIGQADKGTCDFSPQMLNGLPLVFRLNVDASAEAATCAGHENV